jgi:hypothetical protein
LRFGKPHGRAPCCPHATKEESVVPPWWCRIVDDGLDDDEPFFLEKRLVVFFHMVAALFSPLKLQVAIGNQALKILLRDVDFEWIKVVDFF